MIDLDAGRSARAARREGRGAAVTVRLSGQTFTLPVELPGSVLDLLLDGDLDLASLIATAVRVWQDQDAAADNREQAALLVAQALVSQPTLPVDVIRVIRAAIAALFGPEQWARFLALQPTLADLAMLARGLVQEYGVGLGEALASSTSSAPDGTTPTPTSNSSTASTFGVSGLALATPVV